jgi:hypothetical protein
MARTSKKQADAPATIPAIKAFDKDLSCRGFQFQVGKTYAIDGSVKVCERGFHAVDPADPFHVWDFYPIIDDNGSPSRYADVELSGKTQQQRSEGGTKIAAASIAIKAKITLPDFIRRAVAAVIAATKGKNDRTKIGASGYGTKIGASGDWTKIGASGDWTKIGASGDRTQIGASGDRTKIGASGDRTQIGASGDRTKIGASGYGTKIGASGYGTKIGASGDRTQIGASGDWTQIGASGDWTQIEASGKNSVIASAGKDTHVKGAVGTHVAIAEYNDAGECIGFATGKIEKTDTWYRAKGLKLVEVS